MKNIILSVCIYIIALPSTQAQAVFETMFTANNTIHQVAGHEYDELYAYTTANELIIVFEGTSHTYTDLSYNFDGTTYHPQISSITDLALNDAGRLYINTSEGHLLMYDDGVFLAGLPFVVRDLYSHVEAAENVYGLLELGGNLYPVEFLDDFDEVDILINHFDDDLQAAFNGLDAGLLAPNDGINAYVDKASQHIGISYESGHELKIHDSVSSNFPCNTFKDLVNIGPLPNPWGMNGVFLQLYLICGDGKVSFVTKLLDNLNSFEEDWVEDDWDIIDLPGMGYGEASNIQFAKYSISATPDERYFVFGITDASENGLFIISPRQQLTCHLDAPGSGKLNDIYVNNQDYIYVCSGPTFYRVNLNEYNCDGSTPVRENAATFDQQLDILENPTSGYITAILKNIEVENIGHIALYNTSGQHLDISPEISGDILKIPVQDLGKGLYFLRVPAGRQQYWAKVVVE